MPNATLNLAVAGSRKTQGIVDTCALEPKDKKILILTYTTANQVELRSRLTSVIGDHANIQVEGWFSFLINYFVKPYLPYSFPDAKVRGFDFDSPPRQGTRVTDKHRYFNPKGSVLKVHLPQLAHRVNEASGGQPLTRLGQMYDQIFIDEVQDLCGYDLDVLELLIKSGIRLHMVGDVRQAILATNERERRNSPYMYMNIWNWLKNCESQGLLSIQQNNITWRCRQEIASFADSLFSTDWGFDSTISNNSHSSGHDGIFLVKQLDVPRYLETYNPMFLRQTANSGRSLPYQFTNIGLSKGLTRERILILPTQAFKDFIVHNQVLADKQASMLYVAVTRAEQSVAFVVDDNVPGYTTWTPR